MAAYQVILLRAGNKPFEVNTELALRQTLAAKLLELGLNATDLEFLSEADVLRTASPLSDATPAAAVYMSDTTNPAHSAVLDLLRDRAILILPFVSTLNRFQGLVPAVLHPINGMGADPSDPDRQQLANRLLEELRLLRRQRRAFISYRRVESSGVALQLREELQLRRYDVFLDSFSVEHGVDFQSALWHEMGNTDVVVLLNTVTAFDSKWVEDEIARANLSGLAVLQLIWPSAPRHPGTEFAEPRYLSNADFGTSSPTNADTKLDGGVADSIASQVETLRARAQAARRRHVVAELKAAADRAGVGMVLEQNGVARLERAATAFTAGVVKRLIPVVGFPDARVLHEHHAAVQAGSPPWDHVVFDDLGLLAVAKTHLDWLNQYLPPKSLPIQDVDTWMQSNLK